MKLNVNSPGFEAMLRECKAQGTAVLVQVDAKGEHTVAVIPWREPNPKGKPS